MRRMVVDKRAQVASLEDYVRQLLRGRGMSLKVSVGGRPAFHWMIDADGRRVVDFWPVGGTWRDPHTGETGKVNDPAEIVEVASKVAALPSQPTTPPREPTLPPSPTPAVSTAPSSGAVGTARLPAGYTTPCSGTAVGRGEVPPDWKAAYVVWSKWAHDRYAGKDKFLSEAEEMIDRLWVTFRLEVDGQLP